MKKEKAKVRNYIFIVLIVGLVNLGNMPCVAYGALNPSNFVTDLNTLILEGNALVASMESVVLSPLTMASQLTTLEASVLANLNNVGDVYKVVAASTDNTTMSLTNEMLIPLQTLSTIMVSMAQSLTALSNTMVLLSTSTSTAVLEASLASMLRLSDDIGMMADRILEMADKILIMADNIGLMADRILATQVIQSDNIKAVIDAALETQKNILLLFALLN